MYPEDLYFAFVQLRKQLYKIKTRKGLSKYSDIENNIHKYKTFLKFYDEVTDFYLSKDKYIETQEVFDRMLDLSQSKRGLKYNCY